jgi:hypothetical protein
MARATQYDTPLVVVVIVVYAISKFWKYINKMLSKKQLYNNIVMIKVHTCLLIALIESYQYLNN